MFLRHIVERIDALEPGAQFRKWTPFFLNISGVFAVIIIVVFAMLHLESADASTRGSGVVSAVFKTLMGLLITGGVGITLALLFWNRSRKIAALAEKSQLTFSSISGNITRFFGEASFIKLNGIAILCLAYLLFGARGFGGSTLIFLALSFLSYFIGVGFLQFAYVISDISTHLTAATAPETPPSEESRTTNHKEHSPESADSTAATAPETVSSDAPLEKTSTMDSPDFDVNNAEHQAELDAQTDSDIYISKFWWFVIGLSGPFGIISAFLKAPTPMPHFLAGKTNTYKITYAKVYRAKGRRTQVIFSILGFSIFFVVILLFFSTIFALIYSFF